MFNSFFNTSPTVEDQGSYYIISGINHRAFEADLKTQFGTSVIGSRILNKVSGNRFKIHKFFTIELSWLLDNLVNNRDRRSVRYYRVGIHKYNQLLKELNDKTWITTTFRKYKPYDLDKALRKFSYKPLNNQREFLENYANIKYGFQLKGCLLDAVPGSGKSVSSLMWSEMISPHKTIILVPKHLVNVPWINHIDPKGTDYCLSSPRKYWTSLDKTNPLEHMDADYFIIYSENLRKDSIADVNIEYLLKALSKDGKEPLKLIIDECHRYNDHKSQQTQGMISLASNTNISDVLFMSGTPIKGLGKETYPMFVVLDKYFDKYVRDDFLKMYGRDNYYLNQLLAHRLGRIKYSIKSITDMGKPPEPVILDIKFPGCEKYTLKSIRTEMVSFIKDRVHYYNKEMPNYIYDFNNYIFQYRNTILNDKESLERLDRYLNIVERFKKKGYNNFTDSDLSKYCKEVEKDIESILKGEDLKYFRHIKTAVKYVGLKIRGEALGNILGKARVEAVKETIHHAELPKLINGVIKKTAIYSGYIDAIDYCDEYLREQGYDTIKISGDNSSEIDNLIRLLRDEKSKNPLITSFQTLSEGYPLLMCNQLIILNSPWRSYQLEQVIARIFRKGQDTECFVYIINLDTGGEVNVTSRNIDIMKWSEEIVDQLLNGGTLGNNINGVSMNFKVDNGTLIDEFMGLFTGSHRPKLLSKGFLNML